MIVHADCLAWLPALAEASMDSPVTDPAAAPVCAARKKEQRA